MRVGTSRFRCFQRRRLYVHLLPQMPASCSAHRFRRSLDEESLPSGSVRSEAVVTGSLGLPSVLPARRRRGGFHRYEPVFQSESLRSGASSSTYPTRNFAGGLPQLDAEWSTRLVFESLPACRHADGTISSSARADVRRMASEDSDLFDRSFLLIFRTGRFVTALVRERVAPDPPGFPAYGRISLRQRLPETLGPL